MYTYTKKKKKTVADNPREQVLLSNSEIASAKAPSHSRASASLTKLNYLASERGASYLENKKKKEKLKVYRGGFNLKRRSFFETTDVRAKKKKRSEGTRADETRLIDNVVY